MKPEPRKYRKKPVVIEAFQWQPDMGDVGGVCLQVSPVTAAVGPHTCLGAHRDISGVWLPSPHVHTLEGPLRVSPGDHIITGVKGEKYPVKPDIFEATYEPVD